MKSTAMLKLATSALVMGTTMVGCTVSGQGAHAANASDIKTDKVAAKAAEKARVALVAKKFDVAVASAETAVAASPRNAFYRLLLGQAYLGAGRFASAETSFADVLTLDPDNAKAALNLALVEIAQGKKDRALSTLTDYREKLSGADYGLAITLAGDIREGLRVMELMVRDPSVDARVRQNLALAYALDGQWVAARTMASVDLTAADADARMLQWASLARPDGAKDQVASLLGVHPVSDSGQPTRLALAPSANQAIQTAIAEPVRVPEAVAEIAPTVPPAPEVMATEAAQPAFETTAVAPIAVPAVVVAPVVKLKPKAPLIRAMATPAKQQIVLAAHAQASKAPVVAKLPAAAKALPKAAPRAIAAGKFVVQLGAFENAAVSRDAWNRMAPRFGLSSYDPANAATRVGNASFVRLSVGGFVTREEAKLVCTRIQAAGGKCFVRGMASDAPAEWVQRGAGQKFAKAPAKPVKPVRVASR